MGMEMVLPAMDAEQVRMSREYLKIGVDEFIERLRNELHAAIDAGKEVWHDRRGLGMVKPGNTEIPESLRERGTLVRIAISVK